MGGRRSHSCWFSDMFDDVGGGEILSGGSRERGLIAPFGAKQLPNSAVVRRGIRPTRKPESKAGRLSTT